MNRTSLRIKEIDVYLNPSRTMAHAVKEYTGPFEDRALCGIRVRGFIWHKTILFDTEVNTRKKDPLVKDFKGPISRIYFDKFPLCDNCMRSLRKASKN